MRVGECLLGIALLGVFSALAWAAPPQGGVPTEAPSPAQAFDPPDPARTRLGILPTARTLDRGDVTVRLIGLPPPLVQVGITDRVSFGAAALWRGVLLTPKIQVLRGERTQGAIGTYHAVGRGYSGGLAYAVVTHGSEDAAVTAGAGWVYSDFLGQGRTARVLLLGGERRITPRGKVIAEALVTGRTLMTIVGVRHIRRRVAIEGGAAAIFTDDGFIAMPQFNVSWRF
jgi:hypothetical protein